MDEVKSIISILSNYHIYITLALCALLVVFAIIIIVLLSNVNKLEKKYRKLMRGTNNKNLEELLLKYLDTIDDVKDNNEEIKDLCNNTKMLIEHCIQKVAIVRYKAFEDVGSDLSYSIALLDGNNDGIVLTSIYGRNESTTYAKPIDKGISRYDLSEEEESVLHEAINKFE